MSTCVKREMIIPEREADVIPFRAGQKLPWSFDSSDR